MSKNENIVLSESLAKLRRLQEENEQENGVLDAIPYTSNDDILAKMTNEAKTIFGADFTKSNKPMLYYPEDGDVTLTGEVNALNNSKFQFKLNSDSESGILLWVDSLPITDNVVTILSKMNGAGKNWKKELNEIGRKDLKPVSARDDDYSAEQISESRIDGDDLPSEPKGFENGDDYKYYYVLEPVNKKKRVDWTKEVLGEESEAVFDTPEEAYEAGESALQEKEGLGFWKMSVYQWNGDLGVELDDDFVLYNV